MTYSDIFAFRIRQLCKNRGITINKLATLAGLKQSTIDNILRGASKNPKIRTLHKIANVFGMTLSEFLDFPELNNYSIDDEEDEEISQTNFFSGTKTATCFLSFKIQMAVLLYQYYFYSFYILASSMASIISCFFISILL